MKDADDAVPAPPTEQSASDPNSESTEASAPAASEDAAPVDPPVAAKAKTPSRRKSGTVPEHKGKKLNRKASKAQILHLDAKPGDQFFIKLKGYPLWPCIICDEDMLPHALLKNRPVSAMRPDGTYREDFADGSKKAADRSFPIMYLSTNEL